MFKRWVGNAPSFLTDFARLVRSKVLQWREEGHLMIAP